MALLCCCASFTVCSAQIRATEVEDRFFDSNGVKIRYVVFGKGEPVVLIHGYSGDIEMGWIEGLPPGDRRNPPVKPKVIPVLQKEFQVIAMDCRGHGKGDKPHTDQAYGREMVEGKDTEALASVARSWPEFAVSKAELTANRVPVLATIAEEDFLKPLVAELADKLSCVEVEIVPGYVHESYFSSDHFAESIQRFLKGASSGSAE